MAELLTAAQMRDIERAAFARGAVTGLELMERAGRGVVDAVFREWPDLGVGPHCAAILCGPGNNGGDGFVVARLLRGRGWGVTVYLHGEAARLPPDARANHDRWIASGEAVFGLTEASRDSATGFAGKDVIFDALFGIGLSRPIEARWREVIDRIDLREPGVKSVAIDIPSGFDSDTGEIVDFPAESLDQIVSHVDAQRIARFDMTITFHAMKRAHAVPECARHCGRIIVVDIGLPHG